MRECMVRILECAQDLSVVGQVADGRNAIAMTERYRPCVGLVDIDLPILNGVETVRRMWQQAVPSVVVCTTPDRKRHAAHIVMQAGASACLGQQCSPHDVLEAIRHAKTPTARAMPREPIHKPPASSIWTRVPARPGIFETLTPREREVLQLLAEGYVAKEISDLLIMSVKTVSTHRVHITEKVGTHSIALLTKFAIREGLTHL